MSKKNSGDWICVYAPANIAFIKYWGKVKEPEQVPTNTSLSMTLNSSRSYTRAQQGPSQGDEFYFNDMAISDSSAFGSKIFKHLKFLRNELSGSQPSQHLPLPFPFPFPFPYLRIESFNTFPDSCGLASSASGFAALTLAALGSWFNSSSWSEFTDLGLGREQIADLARMGSGSSCRSFVDGFCSWSPIIDKQDPSSTSGIKNNATRIEKAFGAKHWDLYDTILVISNEAKSTLSTSGHKEAQTSILFEARVSGIPEKMTRALHYLGEQNLENLGPILEAEALEMHAVMLTQKNPLHYLQQETMQTIAWLRNARQRTGLKAYFTIDAGPNLHVISDRHNQIALLQLLKNERPSGVKQVIEDKVGTGADFCSLDDWLIKKQKDPEK